jgi:hypothetical protein
MVKVVINILRDPNRLHSYSFPLQKQNFHIAIKHEKKTYQKEYS